MRNPEAPPVACPALIELVEASNALNNEMPGRTFRGRPPPIPASPGWAAALKRQAMAWVKARHLVREARKV